MHLFKGQNQEFVSNFRINSLKWIIFLLVIAIIIRLFYVQILNHDKYTTLAAQQHQMIKVIQPERGEIFALSDNNPESQLYPLAINQIYYEVYVVPTEISRPQNLADILVDILEVDKDEVLAKLELVDDQYEIIKKEVSQSQLEELKKALDTLVTDINKDKSEQDKVTSTGVYWDKQILRFYPDKETGAHILGFLGYADDGILRVGKYGLEGYWEKELSGIGGQLVADRDVAGRVIPFSTNGGSGVEDGADLILTIDRTVQYNACKALEKAVARYDAVSGTVIIMETATGAIRAMCNFPSFDPNQYNQVETVDTYNNLAVYYNYEPGSVMKAIAMAIAIDTGKVAANTIFEDKGEIKIADYTIQNSDLKAHGFVDMTEVLSASLNTGIIFATSEIKNKIFEDYMKKFGFGHSTELNISQENEGDISALAKWGDIYRATASYGQGITVTPLQMLNAINVLANRGQLVQSYIVSQINYIDGRVEEFKPTIIRRVVSESTAATLSAMMVQVVDSGHAVKAAVPGYYIAGKTGTAQVVNPDTGHYYYDKSIHNFVGFAPVENPKFTMIVKLDYPTAAAFSADTTTTVFSEIAKFLLEYYQIPPDR